MLFGEDAQNDEFPRWWRFAALGTAAHYREEVVKTALEELPETEESQWLNVPHSMISMHLSHWESR